MPLTKAVLQQATQAARTRAFELMRAKGVRLIPRGAEDILPPIPGGELVNEDDAERAAREWDRLMLEFVGLLLLTHAWTYNDRTHKYRNTNTGRVLGIRQLLILRDAFIESSKGGFDKIAGRMVAGDSTLQQWTMSFREVLKNEYLDEYALGKGGFVNMTQADFGSVGGMLRNQYGYLDKFAQDIADGKLSEAQIRNRSRMYADSATQAYERGRTRAQGVPQLPAYPGDGSTQCGSQCKCSWQIVETETTFECTWKLNAAAENCPDCLERAEQWAPLIIAKPPAPPTIGAPAV